ncbi:MAG: amidohydrolase [bacterium]
MNLFERRTFMVIIFLCFILSSNLFAQYSEAVSLKLKNEISSRLNQEYAYLDNLYKHLHANPELSFHEEKTASRIANELKNTGFNVTTNVGGLGLVGVLKNDTGPTLLIRTDLDALPIVENTGFEYASKVITTDAQGKEVGVMHACGHDVHMTVFIGTARLLSQLKDKWHGTLVMIGQPAEEKGAGAKAMLTDGLFTRFPRPDYAIALHVHSGIAAGNIGYCKGYALANVDAVDITVRGVGGHGAIPHSTKDPIVLSAQIILALQTIVSREIDPIEPAVVTVGSIHGGTKHNIIPDEVQLQLTLRSYSDDVRNQTIAAIKRICRGIAEAGGVPEDRFPMVTVQDEYTPATFNDPELTERLIRVFKAQLGADHIIKTDPIMGGEDFSRYGREEPKIPISMFWLGSVDPQLIEKSKQQGTLLPSLHSSHFAPLPEPTIKSGVKAMTAAALELLQTK